MAEDAGPSAWETEVKKQIRRRYADLAAGASSSPGGGRNAAAAAGYPPDALAALPENLAASFSGCGYALGGIDFSEVRALADLGCGAGLDACLAALMMPAGGPVYAVDLTPEMAAAAQAAAAQLGAAQILAIAGDMERLPLGDHVVDLVLANAAFNLTLDKHAAFAEAARILRPGGRLAARDLVLDGPLPRELAEDPLGWNTSLGGVVAEARLVAAMAAAGFAAIVVSDHRPFAAVTAVRITARIAL